MFVVSWPDLQFCRCCPVAPCRLSGLAALGGWRSVGFELDGDVGAWAGIELLGGGAVPGADEFVGDAPGAMGAMGAAVWATAPAALSEAQRANSTETLISPPTRCMSGL